MKKIVILQSNYIPWKGYFDLIAAADEFIIYDDVQFTKNDWRNRNLIKTPSGVKWLTIPTGQDISRRICDVSTATHWKEKHWKSLEANYARSTHFKSVSDWLKPFYENDCTNLTEINRCFIENICGYLGIKTKISYSWDYAYTSGKTTRLVDLCVQCGATEYISGPAAKAYLDESLFEESDIKLSWFDYEDYPVYPQLWGEFVHGVSIIDLLFNCGPSASKYLRYVK